MAVELNYSTALRNAMLDTIDGQVGSSGLLRIYDGTIPTNVGTSLGAQVKLAELALSATMMQAASSGSISADTITPDSSADASGTASWGTITTSGGTRVIDFNVSTSGAFLNLDSVSITAGQQVSVTSLSITGGNA